MTDGAGAIGQQLRHAGSGLGGAHRVVVRPQFDRPRQADASQVSLRW